jgi:hypothetical protein
MHNQLGPSAPAAVTNATNDNIAASVSQMI